MVANKRISIGDKLKRVPMGYFNDQSLGELTGITTTVLDEVESTGPMVLVGILGGLINSAVMLLCVLFVAFFKSLGYIICGAVLCFVIMVLIGKRNWLQMVLVSILVPLGMWLVFYKVLTVNIPMGPLQFLRDLVDMI